MSIFAALVVFIVWVALFVLSMEMALKHLPKQQNGMPSFPVYMTTTMASACGIAMALFLAIKGFAERHL